ncbi:MAG: hypothetical protein QOG74_794 [Alphaproteobacteria bacterium]|jgi:hypothetical protein|nr:hypothetical protein [Alphaproteobacteria bacterium]
MAKTSTPAPSFGTAMVVLLRSLPGAFFDPYRPELHYMRGPGPKWREKHGIAASNERAFGSRNAASVMHFHRASQRQRNLAAQMVTTCR